MLLNWSQSRCNGPEWCGLKTEGVSLLKGLGDCFHTTGARAVAEAPV